MSNEVNEERLEDEHVRRSHKVGFLRTVTGIVVLTVSALVVVVPFLYMVMISLKSETEIANGKLFPRELVELGKLKRRDLAWVRVELTDEQSAAVNTLTTVPVVIGSSLEYALEGTIMVLPDDIVAGTVVSREKPSLESRVIIAMIEVPNPKRVIERAPALTVFYPGSIPGTWNVVEGYPVARTVKTLIGRMFGNYRSLVNWAELRNGQLISWLSKGYPRWYLNSIFVAFATVLLGLFFDSLAGFAFAKFDFPFRRALFALLLATIMIPYPVTLVPTFFIFAELGLYNTFAALIVPGVVSAFGIFLVKQYVQTIPDDMIHAARVDGAGDFMVYRHVILPIARPVLAALAVFRFIYQWNGYLYPLVLTNKDSMKTVQLGLATMEDVHGRLDYGVQMAGAALAVVPILIVYAFMQKHFISGITLGSVKD